MADLRITIEAPTPDEERVLGVLSMAGFDAVEVVDRAGAVWVRAYWPLEAGPPPAIDLTPVPGARRLPNEVIDRAGWANTAATCVASFWLASVGSGAPPSAAPEGLIPIWMDAGRGFGFGDHPSTRVALTALAALPRPVGPSVLDVGCGTGVLAIAAMRLGAKRATAVDTDPGARAAAATNARLNEVELEVGTEWPVAADLVVANITTPILAELAPKLSTRVAVGGCAIISGLLEAHGPELAAGFQPLAVHAEYGEDGWAALTLR